MDVRIRALLGAHAVAFIVAAIAAFGHTGPDPAPIVFLALISAEAALLGLWAAIGHTHWHFRLPTVLAALLFFWAAFLLEEEHPGIEDALLFAALISLPCIVILTVISVLHRGSRQLMLRRVSDVSGREGFQFSLGRLMVAVTLVAIALSVGRVTRTMGDAGTRLRLLAVVSVIPPSLVLVALATFWAALGIGRPFPRLLVVIPCTFLVGCAALFAFTESLEWRDFFLWSCLTGTMAIVIAGSLLVVRSAGWRLCSAADERQPVSTSVQEAPPF